MKKLKMPKKVHISGDLAGTSAQTKDQIDKSIKKATRGKKV